MASMCEDKFHYIAGRQVTGCTGRSGDTFEAFYCWMIHPIDTCNIGFDPKVHQNAAIR